MTTTSGFWRTAGAAAIMFLAGCSNEGAQSTSTEPRPGTTVARQIAACSLLTADDVGAAAGVTMRPGKEREPIGGGEGSGRMTNCTWTEATDANAVAIVSLLVWSWPPGSGGAASYLNSFHKAAEEFADIPKPEPVSLGEEGLWDGTALHARTGDVSFSIAVSRPGVDAATAREASETLARQVLAEMD